jgi:hypothetical protein
MLAEAGLGHDTLSRNVGSRSLQTLEKISVVLRWSLAEVMGFNHRIDLELSGEAFAAAERVLTHLPRAAQTRENLVWAHARIYDLLIQRRREVRLPDDPAARREIVQAYEEMLLASWEGKDAGGSETE